MDFIIVLVMMAQAEKVRRLCKAWDNAINANLATSWVPAIYQVLYKKELIILNQLRGQICKNHRQSKTA